jgi:hypothetical protein
MLDRFDRLSPEDFAVDHETNLRLHDAVQRRSFELTTPGRQQNSPPRGDPNTTPGPACDLCGSDTNGGRYAGPADSSTSPSPTSVWWDVGERYSAPARSYAISWPATTPTTRHRNPSTATSWPSPTPPEPNSDQPTMRPTAPCPVLLVSESNQDPPGGLDQFIPRLVARSASRAGT